MIEAALGVVIGLLVVVALLLFAAGRARARALADDVRVKIEPYLRRKAAEAGRPAAAPTWTSRSLPEEIVTYSAALAGRLLDRERQATGAADSLELARTQPAEVATDDLRPPRR